MPLVVTELQPDTEYIVYFVLQGNNSNTYSETMGYRFKTEEVYRPVIQLSINNPSVNIKVDKDSDVDYILIPDDSIPNMLKESFSEYAVPGLDEDEYKAEDFTVLDALMTDVPGQTGGSSDGSVFDWYAKESAKSDLAFLIRNENPGSTIAAQGQESIRANGTVTVDFEDDMKEVTEELIDRFSDVPRSVQTLLSIAYIKSMCKKLKIEKVTQNKNEISLVPLTRYKTKEKIGYKIVNELVDLLEKMCDLNKK